MKRIDDISNLSQKCTGCMACVDSCPVACVSSIEAEDGFKYTIIDDKACISCGTCYSICPIETQKKHYEEQKMFAAYDKDKNRRNNASSGGVFYLLAESFLNKGYHVCGAAFEETILKHRLISSIDEIKPLLKSKYIQSNTEGIYGQILDLLKNGECVFFCGTPCQVSALINIVPESAKQNLVTADIICHGVPSQKVFNDYIQTLEKKHGGKVTDFSFRVKDNKYKHSHGYSYYILKNGQKFVVNGIYTDSTFYNAFKKYLIFRDSCYECQYSTLNRVSDITLADFWGIEKYDFPCDIDLGVSMVVTNTAKGNDAFSLIKEKTVNKEFPLQYAVQSNYCLTHSTKKSKTRDIVIDKIARDGYEATAQKYFGSTLMYKLYWFIPKKIRNFIRKIRGL